MFTTVGGYVPGETGELALIVDVDVEVLFYMHARSTRTGVDKAENVPAALTGQAGRMSAERLRLRRRRAISSLAHHVHRRCHEPQG